MKFEVGKTYVFKDYAARDEFIYDSPVNKKMFNRCYADGFTVSGLDDDGDAYCGGYLITTNEFNLLEEAKPFDISEYKFSDKEGVGTVEADMNNDLVVNLNNSTWILLDEQDAVAIAKHFKLI